MAAAPSVPPLGEPLPAGARAQILHRFFQPRIMCAAVERQQPRSREGWRRAFVRAYCTQSLLALAASQVLTWVPKVVSDGRLQSRKMLAGQALTATEPVQLGRTASAVL